MSILIRRGYSMVFMKDDLGEKIKRRTIEEKYSLIIKKYVIYLSPSEAKELSRKFQMEEYKG